MRVYSPDIIETPDERDQAGQAIPPALERIVIAMEQEDLASAQRIATGIILADRDQLQAQVAYPDQ